MERSAREKKPRKAAAALEAMRAVKSGKRKALDDIDLEDDLSADEAGDDYSDAAQESRRPAAVDDEDHGTGSPT
jgi:hypothetical protein